jgi:subtilisin-like proprotein convertase family protein
MLPADDIVVIVDISEAGDIDIESISPEGATIVMTNTTITPTDRI